MKVKLHVSNLYSVQNKTSLIQVSPLEMKGFGRN